MYILVPFQCVNRLNIQKLMRKIRYKQFFLSFPFYYNTFFPQSQAIAHKFFPIAKENFPIAGENAFQGNKKKLQIYSRYNPT